MTRAQRRDYRFRAVLDFLQGVGVYLAAVAGVVFRRFGFIYRATGSLDTFMGDWPEMVIAVVGGIAISLGFDAVGMSNLVKRKNWSRRMGRSFLAGVAGDGLAGDIF